VAADLGLVRTEGNQERQRASCEEPCSHQLWIVGAPEGFLALD